MKTSSVYNKKRFENNIFISGNNEELIKKSKIDWLQGACGFSSIMKPYNLDKNEITTLYQCNMGYSGTYAVEADCVLAYVHGKAKAGSDILASWKSYAKKMYNGDVKIGIMIPANRDDAEYLETYTKRGKKDIQTTSDGSFRRHSFMNNRDIYYMVPTESYTQYKWESIELHLKNGCKAVAIEEPEMWNNAAYSEGFKEEWLKYYGTEWEDQEGSAEAMFKSQYLKAYLFKRMIEYIADKIKESYPDVIVLVATHSVINYSRHGIATDISMLAGIEGVDGIIGQTWSDGVTMTFPYAGTYSENVFAAAIYEYSSYGDFLPKGKKLYLLQDPASDNPSLTAKQYEKNWKMTVVASLMQQDTDFSQCTIWPQRAYLPMSVDYKSIQQSVYKMYNQLAGKGSRVYSGTKGVCIGLSDSASWNIGKSYTTGGDCLGFVSGTAFSLIYDGIPVDTVCLDRLTSVDQLSSVNLLILSYDSMKPLSEEINDVIAQWVKDGGRLLYLGGYDSFTDITCQWWSEKKTTPLENLLISLGLSDIRINKGIENGTVPLWGGSSIELTDLLTEEYADNTYTFEGSGFETFMTVYGKNTGITAGCGKGEIVCVGLPSATYSKSYSMELTLRQLAALALKGSQNEYSSSEFYTMTSGNYMSYFNWYSVQNTAANKTYIDLFNADLTIIKGGSSLLRNTPILYYDISSLIGTGTPKLAFTNGVETEDATETASATTFTVASPTSSVFASVLLGNGKYPQSVSAVTKSGLKCSLITTWDDENKSLLVKCTSNDLLDPVTVTVKWSDNYNDLNNSI